MNLTSRQDPSRVIRAVRTLPRIRAAIYCVICAVFSLLFVYVTLRSAAAALDTGTLIVAGLTALLCWQTLRWFRRAIGAG